MVQLAVTATPDCGLAPDKVYTQSLRASGAMALLFASIDDNVIKLTGRWRSDKMMKYLHVNAWSLTHNHANVMHNAGNFHLLAPSFLT